MKNKIAFIHSLCLLSCFITFAQISFIEDTAQSFEGAAQGSLAFADIDNDGDQDFLTTGINIDLDTLTTLYKNDGLGNFEIVDNTPFEDLAFGNIAFGDIDNDGDQDLDQDQKLEMLITGQGTINTPLVATLYSNNVNGFFSEISGLPFIGIKQSSIEFVDVDGDTDKDLFMTGFDSTNTSQAKLYLNDFFMLSSTNSPFTFSAKVAPNPFDEYFNVSFENAFGETKLKISNILGQIVFSKQVHSTDEMEISTAHFQSGLYFLNIKNENEKSEIITIYKH